MFHRLCTKIYKTNLPAALIFTEQRLLRKGIGSPTWKPNDTLYIFLILQCEKSHGFQNIFSLSTLALKTLYQHERWRGQLKFGNVTWFSSLDYLTPKASCRVMKHYGELIAPR